MKSGNGKNVISMNDQEKMYGDVETRGLKRFAFFIKRMLCTTSVCINTML